MGDKKHGPLGTKDASDDGRSTPAVQPVPAEPVEAYEEDWYRSLRALAERQQGLAEHEPDPFGPELEETEPPQAADIDEAPALAAEVAEEASLEAPTADAFAGSEAELLADTATANAVAEAEELEPEAQQELEAEEAEDPDRPSVEPEQEPPIAGTVDAPTHGTALAGSVVLEDVTVVEENASATEEPIEPTGPSLTSTDPQERRRALEELAARDLSDTDVERVAGLLFDPDPEIRREALATLGRRPERMEDASLLQALQDPDDEVRAAAVELAVRRGPQDLEPLVPLLAARAWPLTHRTVLHHLPEVVASSVVDDDTLARVLDAVGQMDPGPSDDERLAMSRLAHALGIQRILGSLSGPDVRRLGAVRLLVDDRSPAVVRALASQGGDPVDEIRGMATAAIAELTEAQAEPSAERPVGGRGDESDQEESERIASLARALQDEDATVRHLALSGLAGMERAAIVAWVHDTIRGGDASQLALAASTAQVLRLVEGAADILDAAAELTADARHSLVDALTSFVMPPDQLAGLLGQVREPMRAEAIRMLCRVGGSPLLPHLRSHLEDPSDQVRAAVLEAFGDSGGGAALEVAQWLLENDLSPEMRARAVRVLAKATGALPAAAVVRALSDPDPDVRAIAIETLPDTGGAEPVDALVSSLSDPDDRVRKAAAKRLASRGDDPEIVWSALQMAPPAGRGEIIGSFEGARPGSLTQVALKRLRSSEEDERVLAVEITGWGASPGCVEGAIHALQDPAARVRRAATVALGRLRDPAAAKALGKALGDPDPQVRVGVVRALGVIDDEAVLGFLVSALNDPDPQVREVTSQVLTEWSSPAVAKRLAGVLAVPSLREAATDLLGRIGSPAAELLIEVLMQHNPAVAPAVGQLLQRITQPGEFVSRLEAVEPERRLRGVEALGAIGGPEAVDALVRSVSDPDERIRVRSAQLLADLRDPRAREILRGLARDPVPGVVAAAQEALSRLGADDDRAA